MAEDSRRIGCGCLLPLALFLILVPLTLGLFADLAGGVFPPVIRLFLLAVLAAGILAVLARRRSIREQPEAPPPPPPRPVISRPPPERRAPLATAPEDPATRALKERLVDAVSDLADAVEEMPAPERRLTSEEMIERAKRRITERHLED